MQTQLIPSKICHIFHYHVNIISKLMTEFVTELIEVVHFFNKVTNFSEFANLFVIMIPLCSCSFDIIF